MAESWKDKAKDLGDKAASTAAAVGAKAAEATKPLLEDPNETVGKPTVTEDEIVLYKASYSRLLIGVVALILCFIPPFIFGILMLLFLFYIEGNSGVIVTDKRVLAFKKKFKPGLYTYYEIPLSKITDIGKPMTPVGFLDIIERLWAGDLVIHWEKPGKGHVAYPLLSIYRHRKLKKEVLKARDAFVERAKPE